MVAVSTSHGDGDGDYDDGDGWNFLAQLRFYLRVSGGQSQYACGPTNFFLNENSKFLIYNLSTPLRFFSVLLLTMTENNDEQGGSLLWKPRHGNASDDQDLFMGMKIRRKASILQKDYKGDYIDVPSRPLLTKVLQKQGDNQVLFADKVLKFTGSGKMKRRILLITDFAIYIFDPETDALKRRIALAAVDKMCLSELTDNFFAVIIPTEYDLLMASIRKIEIVTVLVEATNDELDVDFSNSFEYHAASNLVKEIQFEEVEGGVKTRFLRKVVEEEKKEEQ
ncbi:hypothetical protein L6164_012561 [Bauhinia variegata]|uniref:Uncharacterized protein n=1 Tax=Bauhinia variegata TaxID=167791 RepID=A0ACB9PD98_BAUVA|nr:hypothetical protein L6164_012561 [Bauhinia variegata]